LGNGRLDEFAELGEEVLAEVVPWFRSSNMLKTDDKKQTQIPVSRQQTKRLRELFKL